MTSPLVAWLVANIIPLTPLILAAAAAAAPVLVGLWLRSVKDERDREAIRRTVRGAYLVLAAIAPKTATTVDDQLRDMLKAILAKVEEELGRPLKPAEVERVKGHALALQVKPGWPDLLETSPDLLAGVGRAIATPPPSSARGRP